ncbi:MAG: porin [Proteobacteria bacterium]|nr:porin [Pseudomonadota bacterium]
MRQLLIYITAIAANSACVLAQANVPQVTLGGLLDTQIGIVSQEDNFHRNDFINDIAPGTLRDLAVVNDTHIFIKALQKTTYLDFGGEIKLNSDTSETKDGDRNVAEKTMAYVNGKFGRLEAGSYTGASRALQVSAVSLAKATGGIDGDARYWWNDYPGDIDDPRNTDHDLTVSDLYLTVPQLYANNPVLVGIKGVNAAKITYYTPKYQGFTAGISYIPDLNSYGTVFQASRIFRSVTVGDVSTTANPDIFSAAPYRDVIEGGVRYDGKHGDYKLSVALVGQTGSAKLYQERIDSSYGVHQTSLLPFYKLRAWEAGIALGYQNFSVAAAYANNNRSGEMVHNSDMLNNIKSSSYWNIGAAYDKGKLGVSATYMQSRRGLTVGSLAVWPWAINPERSKFTLFSLGFDYKITAGCKLYGEVDVFKAYSLYDSNVGIEFEGPSIANAGHIILLGVKNHF